MRLRFTVIAFVVVSCVVVALVSILPPTFQLINSSEDETHDRFVAVVATLTTAVNTFITTTQTLPQIAGSLYTKGALDFRNVSSLQAPFTTMLLACGPQCTNFYFGMPDDYFIMRTTGSFCKPGMCCSMVGANFSCTAPYTSRLTTYKPTQRPWYAALSVVPAWAPLYVDFSSGGFASTVGGPMISSTGAFLGVMAVDVTFVPLAYQLGNMSLVDYPSAWALYEANTSLLLDSSLGIRSRTSKATLANLTNTPLGPAIASLSSDELNVDGTLYRQSGASLSRQFVAVARVGNVTGVNLRVIVVFNEDPTGSKKNAIVLSSSLTAAAVVLGAALIATLAIVFFERPLNAITDEIEQAVARAMGLKNDDDDEDAMDDNGAAFTMPTSHITELQDITDSFVELVEELKRIRAFVPKSCLVANATGLDDIALIPHETESSAPVRPGSDASSRRSYYRDDNESINGTQSQRGSAKGSRANSGGGSVRTFSKNSAAVVAVSGGQRANRAPAPQLYTGKSLHHATVTYLWIQLRNLTEALEAISDHKVGYDALGLIADCCDVVSSRFKGVIDVYNGDRVTIAFNGMKANANHRRAASECAVVLSRLVRTLSVDVTGNIKLTLNKRTLDWQHSNGSTVLPGTQRSPVFPLGVSSGIATSRALVGNVGSANLARFSIVGACVRASAAEELKCSAAPPSIQCLCDVSYQGDISHSVAYQRVDVGTIAPTRLLIEDMTNHKTATDDGEWMYELQRAQQGNEFNDINDAFEAFAHGDITQAKSKLTAAAEKPDAALAAAVGIRKLEELLLPSPNP